MNVYAHFQHVCFDSQDSFSPFFGNNDKSTSPSDGATKRRARADQLAQSQEGSRLMVVKSIALP
jgi:hypothetical protein